MVPASPRATTPRPSSRSTSSRWPAARVRAWCSRPRSRSTRRPAASRSRPPADRVRRGEPRRGRHRTRAGPARRARVRARDAPDRASRGTARRGAHRAGRAAARRAIVGGGAAGVSSRSRSRRASAPPASPPSSISCPKHRAVQASGACARRLVHARARRARAPRTYRCEGRRRARRRDRPRGEPLAADLVVWATGAAPLPFPCGPGLPLDASGFVCVERTLEVVGCCDLFAVGDCASLPFAPWVRKAGVYAVREGPALDANLRARLCGGRLRAYRPQRDFLALLNLGGGEAIAAKWGVAFRGRGAWRLKDRIDRRFVARFRVLDERRCPPAGSAAPMGMREPDGVRRLRGEGRGARARARTRAAAEGAADPSVRIGLAAPDDAALVVTPERRRAARDDRRVSRVHRRPVVGRARRRGERRVRRARQRRAARHALALVNVPESDPARAEETLYPGARGRARRARSARRVARRRAHDPGRRALRRPRDHGRARRRAAARLRPRRGPALGSASRSAAGCCSRPTCGASCRAAARAALGGACARERRRRARGARGRRDGLHRRDGLRARGHLAALLRASRASACLFAHALPALPGARELLARGVRSTFHAQNARLRGAVCGGRGRHRGGPRADFDRRPRVASCSGWPPRARSTRCGAARRGDRAAAVIGIVSRARADGISDPARPERESRRFD